MPFTPYHFGPNGSVGLVFKKWLDLPVLILANVILDIEVLFAPGLMPHRHWHFHTLLIGGLVGAAFGAAIYPVRRQLGYAMKLMRLSYKPTLIKMVVSGLIGAWLHVLLDATYHWDVQIFWPNRNARPLWNLLSKPQVEYLCLAFCTAAVVLYVILHVRRAKRNCQSTPPAI